MPRMIEVLVAPTGATTIHTKGYQGTECVQASKSLEQALGLTVSGVNEELRRRYNLKEGLKGVVVTRVDPNSPAADKRIQPGDVIVEVGQEPVSAPADVTRRVDALKSEGRKSALLLVSNAQGEVRFVAVSIE